MSLNLLKWIASWLSDRTIPIHHGDAFPLNIKTSIATPHGSILAAALFRLHIRYLSSLYVQVSAHLVADDLAVLMVDSLEKHFSQNI